jgi:hypothetical protein
MTTMSLTKKALIRAEPTADPLKGEALEVFLNLRAALKALMAGIPNTAQIRKPVELQKALGIHNKLAWQVHRIATAPDPLVEVTNVPGSAAMTRFLEAAGKRGVPKKIIAATAQAHRELDELVRTHAEDRSAFDSMIGALAHEDAAEITVQQRRAAFKAQSTILGVQAQMHLALFIMKLNDDDPSQLDTAVVRGMIGLRRFRRDASWTIATIKVENDDGTVTSIGGEEPIAPIEESAGLGLLPQFCSSPLPTMRHMPRADGGVSVVVEPSGLGTKSAVTCLLGHVFRKCQPRYRSGSDVHAGSCVNVRTPCEILLNDVLVQRGLFRETPPTFFACSDHRGDVLSVLQRPQDRLPIREDVLAIGRGISRLHTPEMPSYAELARYVFERLGWNPDEFDVWRCRVEYPVMPSSVVVQFDLPEKPDAV